MFYLNLRRILNLLNFWTLISLSFKVETDHFHLRIKISTVPGFNYHQSNTLKTFKFGNFLEISLV
jgi:hypothetical protein